MAKLTYTMKLGSRPGGSPDCDGWTYHHVLPWRYYYFAGHAVAMVTRYLIASHPKILTTYTKSKLFSAMEGAAGDAGTGGAKLKSNFGAAQADFAAGVDYKPMDLLKLVNALHPNGDILTRIQQEGAINPHTVAALCSNPKFGGFAGMNPSHRLDDPHESFERRRPQSGTVAWWELLNVMAVILESFAPALSSTPDDRTLEVNLTSQFWTVFLPTLEKLVKSHNRVLRFCADDWDYLPLRSGAKRPWNYLTDLPQGKRRDSLIGECFQLNGDGAGTRAIIGMIAPEVIRGAAGDAKQKLYFVV